MHYLHHSALLTNELVQKLLVADRRTNSMSLAFLLKEKEVKNSV
jgi:hypothetical protein